MRPLPPSALFPAGSTDITQRDATLSTGLRVRIVERGAPSAEPVVVIPGWGAPVYMFRHAYTALVERGMRVIGTELRGFGLSDKPRRRGAYTLRAYLDDLDALLDHLALDRATLVGQSMAGGVVLHYALERPSRVRRAVLINPTGLVRLPYLWLLKVLPRRAAEAQSRRVVRPSVVRFILERLVYADASRVSDEDVVQYWSATQFPGFGYAARSTLSEFDWSAVSDAAAARLAVPTMVMLGDADRLVPNTEAAAGRLRGALVTTLRGGHAVHEENPSAAYRAIADFLMER